MCAVFLCMVELTKIRYMAIVVELTISYVTLGPLVLMDVDRLVILVGASHLVLVVLVGMVHNMGHGALVVARPSRLGVVLVAFDSLDNHSFDMRVLGHRRVDMPRVVVGYKSHCMVVGDKVGHNNYFVVGGNHMDHMMLVGTLGIGNNYMNCYYYMVVVAFVDVVVDVVLLGPWIYHQVVSLGLQLEVQMRLGVEDPWNWYLMLALP